MATLRLDLEAGRYPTEAELALTASAAALALDRRLRGRDADLAAVLELVEALSGRLELTASRQRGLLDPMTADLLRRALVHPDQEETSVQGLRSAAQEFLSRLSRVGERRLENDLAELRDKCVAVSQSAQASMEAFREDRPSHRYRR